MYDKSRVPSYNNVPSHPYRVQYSHWSPDTPTIQTAITPTLLQTTGTLSSTSYFSQPQRAKQVTTPNYVNYTPPSPLLPLKLPLSSSSPSPSSSSSSSRLHHFQRPKSSIVWNVESINQAVLNGNSLRQRSESKAIIGIVKPMVHQRSFTQLNNTNNESKFPELMTGSYGQILKRSLYPSSSSIMSHAPSETSAVVYRSRPISSYNNLNSHPPMVPRRHSSINNSKSFSSHRSSRTTSRTSSILGFNEFLATPPSSNETEQQQQQQHEQEQQENEDRITIDVKRLEMFYGSVGTIIKSACSIARLYTATTRQLVNFKNWSYQQRGVPVWIYNTGANLKRAQQVRLLLAQHESCFGIWSSLVSDKAELHLLKDNYMTCWLPESNLFVVFLFECNDACRLFFRYYYEILEHERRMNLANQSSLIPEIMIQQQTTKTSSNNKEVPRRYSRLRTISNKHDQEKEQQESNTRRCRSLSRIRTVKKSAISGPINFEHVNHISSGCNQERPLSNTVTLRSLHASMSHLPTNGTLIDRYSKQTKNRASTLFEPRTTAV
ncbi:unnamed protein product [Rotaria socialis]|uniref:CRIB domain-containing protein n=8 Tax=Rotaria socialis TaxID=392032 RepID=A0A817UT65_9BILA|nr:unnamed protein product [Rotaria socialis]CAF3457543.1 unnamed protein product [Rotaria socialis]CAF4441952.1 unnamed protein product [Rotaria socialis]CAF4559287.1 unnamed protein product [Rotaria socialis]